MKLSPFGQKFGHSSGISELMEDLGAALSGSSSDIKMLGGGNPAHIPKMDAILQETLLEVASDAKICSRVLGDYDPPEGHAEFREALAHELKHQFAWDINADNIFLSCGSQSSFYYLFNAINGPKQRIQLPLVPEYIGYRDIGAQAPFFRSFRPRIELRGEQRFKYRVAEEAFHCKDDVSALCVSRPTNPTGNVLTDQEIQGLSELALQRDIPLILDSAYGVPFPSMIFSHAQPFWNENVILSMSLSKFGLPATRTGIVIASKDMVKTLGRINSIQSLATPSLGAELGLKLIQKGQLFSLSEHLIRPFYHNKVKAATQQLEAGLKGLPCRIHEPEGALFLWLWCQDLPISSKELYERLKSKNVLVIPGENFFPGLEDPNWEHQQQCIRISYAQDDATVKAGLDIIIETLKALYP